MVMAGLLTGTCVGISRPPRRGVDLDEEGIHGQNLAVAGPSGWRA
jgi:hypothetical protein